MINKHQLKEFKKKITTEILNTQKKINQYKELCKPIAPENSIGRISRMDAINNKSVIEAALIAMKDKMIQLQNVKKNINDSNFGICQKCKQSIPLQRLMIQPHSKFCVLCAQ